MGKGVNSIQFKECLNKGRIKKFSAARGLVTKELRSCRDDLKAARRSFKGQNYKWSTIQAYYSMFHAGRTLIYSRGYRERSHYCLIVAIKLLFVAEGLLDIKLVEALQIGKELRENADYEDEFSKASAQNLLDKADELLSRTKEILKV